MTVLKEKWHSCRCAHKENIPSAAKTCRPVLPPFRTRQFKPSRPEWLKQAGKAVEYRVWASLSPFIEPLSYSWAAVGSEC